MTRRSLLILTLLFTFFFSSCTQVSDNSQVLVSVEVQKELFPVMAKFISEGNTYSTIPPVVKWKIKNGNDNSVHVTLKSELSGWAPSSIMTMDLKPNEYREVSQTPFGPQLLNKHSIIPATIILRARIDEKTIYEKTENIKIRPADDMIWSLNSNYDTAPLVAAWVTPNDEMVEKILSNARGNRFFGREELSGYQNSDVVPQIKAIFNSVRDYGISYVSSRVSFGKVGVTQRVRFPRESISQKMANCIDGSVLFASLFENIGLEPLIVLTPTHAFVGVRLSPGSGEILFIETTMVGRDILESILTLTTTFDASRIEGARIYDKEMYNNPSLVKIIDIKKAREQGIYPLL